MSLLFIDGFDHYATADIAKKWNSSAGGGNTAISSSNGRRGGGALSAPYNGGGVQRAMAPGASFVMGFAFTTGSYPTTSMALAALKDAGTTQCALLLNSDGTLSVVRSTGTALTSGTSVSALSVSTYYYIEWKVTIADSISAGSCKVKVNGVDWITVATGQDTKNTSNASANQIYLGPWNAGSGPTVVYFDDFYLCDQSGSVNNDFLGDVRIDTLYPTSDGNYSQFTPSTGSSHFALVDETTPNTSDYNDGAAVNDRDSYGMGNLAPLVSQTVYGVQVNAAILKDDAGSKSAATFVRSSGTNGDGAGVALGTSQVYVSQVFETDPNGSIAWTETTVNAMEAGVKVTA
jgi:hypothetical protein